MPKIVMRARLTPEALTKLRAKSEIHSKVISKSSGRRKINVEKEVKAVINKKYFDGWCHNGDKFQLYWHKSYIEKDLIKFKDNGIAGYN